MMDTSIKQTIQRMMDPYIPRIVLGIVTETSPLEIVLEDDIGVRLHDQSLIIPSRIDELAEDDELYMLSVAMDSVYYVLDKV